MFDVHLHAVLITVKISLIMANLSLNFFKTLLLKTPYDYIYRTNICILIFNIHSVNRHNHSKKPKPVNPINY